MLVDAAQTGCRRPRPMSPSRAMKRLAFALILSVVPVAAPAQPPLRDAITLNIGLNCQWQQRCIAQQQRAMKRALSYVKKKQPAVWRVEQCNRNAARSRNRVDWIGFDNCIRNATLRPTPARALKKRARRLTAIDGPAGLHGERG
jgi:hypothetical protein